MEHGYLYPEGVFPWMSPEGALSVAIDRLHSAQVSTFVLFSLFRHMLTRREPAEEAYIYFAP